MDRITNIGLYILADANFICFIDELDTLDKF